MGPWPGIEPGWQNHNLRANPTPPQPWGVVRHVRGISTIRRWFKKPVV